MPSDLRTVGFTAYFPKRQRGHPETILPHDKKQYLYDVSPTVYFFMSPNTNGQVRPYIGNNAQYMLERRENIVSLNTRISNDRIENSISDKPPLYWTYIRKGTVSQYIQVTRCIAKTLRSFAYTQPSLILMFPAFYIITLKHNLPYSIKSKRSILESNGGVRGRWLTGEWTH